jgi:DNA-binding CsgD family transcriptional regulator
MPRLSQDTLLEELYELRRRIQHFESAFAQTAYRQEGESWKSSVNTAIADLSYSLATTTVSVAGIADIVLNYAKVFTQSEYGYVSSIDPVTGDNLCHTLTGMIGDSCKIPETQKGIIFPLCPDGKYPALWGHSLNTRKAFYTNNPAAHPASTGTPKGHIPLRNFLSVPAMIADELYGQISLANSLRDYTDYDLEAIKRFAAIYALTIQKETIQRMLEAGVQQGTRLAERYPMKRQRRVSDTLAGGCPDSRSGLTATGAAIEEPLAGSLSNDDELQASILANITRLIEPYLTQLQQTSLTPRQRRYLDIIRHNLDDIVSSFPNRVKARNVDLTPQEMQVASLVRSGAQTKEIADLLGISVNAVNFHRRNIRAKFGLTNRQINLRCYLSSLTE